MIEKKFETVFNVGLEKVSHFLDKHQRVDDTLLPLFSIGLGIAARYSKFVRRTMIDIVCEDAKSGYDFPLADLRLMKFMGEKGREELGQAIKERRETVKITE